MAKKVEKKAAPAKKPAPAKKAAPAKKPEPKVDAKKVYHVAKRKEDGLWTVKFANGDKVIKTFKTKEEALAYTDKMAENQGASVAFHASKGTNKGKIQKR